MVSQQLNQLVAGQTVIYGGNRVVTVDATLAGAFKAGDRLLIDETHGELLHVPRAEYELAQQAVSQAVAAFEQMGSVTDKQISGLFHSFADALAAPASFEPIAAANKQDVAAATARGRSTTRLELTPTMHSDMVAGLRGWAAAPTTANAGGSARSAVIEAVEHESWRVEARRAPLGVVGFVFEGRPNVFADAAGVLRTGNTVVFRIGSDALKTAQAIVEHALHPALIENGLPVGAVSLIESASHAAGWAMMADQRLALAVARGSGRAVAQLGAVARHAGNNVSLHGTGGAWVIADATAKIEDLGAVIENSLDRKVCNTVNTICLPRQRAGEWVPAVVAAVAQAGRRHGRGAVIHLTEAAKQFASEVIGPDSTHRARLDSITLDRLGHEWEWEDDPEVTLHVVDSTTTAIALFNQYSPRFVASLISTNIEAHEDFYERIDAPFVGDGFTRWVDGQYALNQPELGLSNWEFGRTLARGGILSGDSVFTVRYRATMSDPQLRR